MYTDILFTTDLYRVVLIVHHFLLHLVHIIGIVREGGGGVHKGPYAKKELSLAVAGLSIRKLLAYRYSVSR